MCSVSDDFVDGSPVEEALVPLSSSQEEEKLCKKCHVSKTLLVLDAKDSYCKACFLTSSVHKLRSALGKHKAMRPNDRVAATFDGSASSMAMLHLIGAGSDCTAQKRQLLFHSTVLIVDESGLFLDEEAERSQFVGGLISSARHFQFPILVCSLEHALLEEVESCHVQDVGSSDSAVILPEAALTKKLKDMFEETEEESAKEHLLHQLKRRILASAAGAMGFQKLFTAESATSLAVSLLAGIATGRGIQLSLDTGFLDCRNQPLQVIRPLREFSRNELDLYCRTFLSDCPVITPLSFATQLHRKKKKHQQDSLLSIEKLTEDFICGLQQNFPATVPTIFRTGDKLLPTAPEELLDGEGQCSLCRGVLDTSVAQPCSLQSTRFSQLVSLKGPQNLRPDELSSDELQKMTFEQEEEEKEEKEEGCFDGCKREEDTAACCSGGCGGSKPTADDNSMADKMGSLEASLCYSCRLVVAKMKSLPDFLVADVMRKSRRQRMKRDIQNFLL